MVVAELVHSMPYTCSDPDTKTSKDGLVGEGRGCACQYDCTLFYPVYCSVYTLNHYRDDDNGNENSIKYKL